MANQRTTREQSNTQRDDRAPNEPRNDQRRQQQAPSGPPTMNEERRSYLAKQYGLTPGQLDVMRNVICVSATDEELEFFLATCKRSKLDPFSRQIYFIKRAQKLEDDFGNSSWVKVGKPETSIDGLRAIAEMAGDYKGQAPIMWCGSDGEWKDVWLKKEPPHAAKATVYREALREPMIAVALFEEYVPRFKNGGMPHMWERMGANQISKCAESLALRRAFPRDMSGLYTDTEMERATADAANYVAPAAKQQAIDVAEKPAAKQLDTKKGATIDELLASCDDEDREAITKMRETVKNAKTRDDVSDVGRECSIATKTTTEPDAYTLAVRAIVVPELQAKWKTFPPPGARPASEQKTAPAK